MIRILLVLLLFATPVMAANFADTDQTYMWDPSTSTQYYPTFLQMKSAIFEDLDLSSLGAAAYLDATQGVIGDVVIWVSDGEGNPSLPISTVTVQATDPTALNATEGRLTLSTASGNLFFKSAAGFFTIQGTYVAD